ncbi:uncharacterized protein LOC143276498 [Babylonia areolata]|uniref:uncharacterized protein LOC143276498 n=1 Tax=Babylonia areolata TaxID=304850 RepID=UPI003FD08D2A
MSRPQFQYQYAIAKPRYTSQYGVSDPQYVSHYRIAEPQYYSNYGTSKGMTLFRRGPYKPTPVNNYLSGNGKSHVYEGSGYYVPSERIWQNYVEYRSLPKTSRRDAILMESEDQWVAFMRKRDSVHQPGGVSIRGYPDLYRRNPLPQMLPFRTKAWIRKWDGPGFFYPPSDSWVHEQVGPGIPGESYRFYNEEDWIKFKYMSDTPRMEFVKKPQYNVPLAPGKVG